MWWKKGGRVHSANTKVTITRRSRWMMTQNTVGRLDSGVMRHAKSQKLNSNEFSLCVTYLAMIHSSFILGSLVGTS